MQVATRGQRRASTSAAAAMKKRSLDDTHHAEDACDIDPRHELMQRLDGDGTAHIGHAITEAEHFARQGRIWHLIPRVLGPHFSTRNIVLFKFSAWPALHELEVQLMRVPASSYLPL